MNQNQSQSPQKKKFFAEELIELGIAAQPAILEETLKAGIPITFCDDLENFVQKNPDGSIIILHKNEGQ